MLRASLQNPPIYVKIADVLWRSEDKDTTTNQEFKPVTVRFGEQRLVRLGSSGMEHLLFRCLGVADPAHYLHKIYLDRELSRIPDFSPTQILDAGCGAGDFTFYLARQYPRSSVVGVDMSEADIQGNRDTSQRLGLHNVEFRLDDLRKLTFRSLFDLVISIDVLEYIPEWDDALGCLVAALKPGGMIFFHVPTVRERPVPFSNWLTGFHARAAREYLAQPRSPEQFVSAIRATGLEILNAYRTFGYWTGELATSLSLLPYAPTAFNRLVQGLLLLPCRTLAFADTFKLDRTRYAVAVLARKPDSKSKSV